MWLSAVDAMRRQKFFYIRIKESFFFFTRITFVKAILPLLIPINRVREQMTGRRMPLHITTVESDTFPGVFGAVIPSVSISILFNKSIFPRGEWARERAGGSRRVDRSKLNLMGWIRAGRPAARSWIGRHVEHTRDVRNERAREPGADGNTYVPPNNVIASHPGWYRWLMAKPSFPPWSPHFPFAPSPFARKPRV